MKRRRVQENNTGIYPDDIKVLLCTYLLLDEIPRVLINKNWARAIANGRLLWRVIDASLFSTQVQVDSLLRYIAQHHGDKVEEIRLHRTRASEETLIFLAKRCPKVGVIDLCFSKAVSDQVVDAFSSHAKEIRVFHAAQCPLITDASLEALRRHGRSLSEIVLGHCRQITSIGVSKLVIEAPRLETVHFQGCPKVDNTGLIAIATSCRRLRRLHLGGGGEISNSGVLSIAQHCPDLEQLDISSSNPFRGNQSVSDESMVPLLKQLVGLKALSVSGFVNLSPRILSILTSHNTQLASLDLGGCKGITQQSTLLVESLSVLKHLKTLSLWSCKTVTDKTVVALAKGCQELVHIDLDGCPDVTTASVQYLKNRSM